MLSRLYWSIYSWFWGFLPDHCREPGCSRWGVRGNELSIEGRPVCDYCHAKMLMAERKP